MNLDNYTIAKSTAKHPGYGVKPLANNTQAEKNRFKADYFNAMLRKFGSDDLALQAFIHGPGSVMRNNPGELTKVLQSTGKVQRHEPHNVNREPLSSREVVIKQQHDATDWQGSSHVMPQSAQSKSPLSQFLLGVGGEMGLGSMNLVENLGGRKLLKQAGDLDRARRYYKNQLDELKQTDAGKFGASIGGIVPFVASGGGIGGALSGGMLSGMSADKPTDASIGKELLASLVGHGAGRVAGGLFKPTKEVKELMRQGIQPSVGQSVGGWVDSVEKLAGGSKLFGDAVSKARKEDIDPGFNLLTHILFTKAAALMPHITLPMAATGWLAGHLLSEPPAQKALLGGYKLQELLKPIAKGEAIREFRKQ